PLHQLASCGWVSLIKYVGIEFPDASPGTHWRLLGASQIPTGLASNTRGPQGTPAPSTALACGFPISQSQVIRTARDYSWLGGQRPQVGRRWAAGTHSVQNPQA